MTELIYELKSEAKYNNAGTDANLTFITIQEPNGKVASYASIIKAQIGKSLASMAEMYKGTELAEASNTKDDSKDGTYTILVMGGGDIGLCLENFKSILKENALAEGEKPFTNPIWNSMGYKDLEDCFAEWLENFMKL